MKGIIFDLKKYAIHDGPGIRTTVFFKGCPLNCWWCHNPESRSMHPESMTTNQRSKASSSSSSPVTEIIGREAKVDEIMKEIVKDTIYYDESGGGVTFSGGEPLLQADFLKALLMASKDLEIHTAVDTCGHVPYPSFEKINDYVDLYLYDIKMIDENEHIRFTGVSNDLILNNLERLLRAGKQLDIRIPLIPGITDTDENIARIIRYLKDLNKPLKVHLLPYNKIGEAKYERFSITRRIGMLETQKEHEIEILRNTFEEAGINVA